MPGRACICDRAAFGQLYERYARMVHGILLARVPSHEVDDLVHDVFLQALRHLHTLRDEGAFGGWLCRITRNRATDYHRRPPASDELPEEIPGRPAPAFWRESAAASCYLPLPSLCG